LEYGFSLTLIATNGATLLENLRSAKEVDSDVRVCQKNGFLIKVSLNLCTRKKNMSWEQLCHGWKK